MAKWSNEFLDEMRKTGDKPADLVADILWLNRNRPIIDDLKALSKNHHRKLSKNILELEFDVDLSDEELEAFEEYYKITDHIEDSLTEKDLEDFKISSEIFDKYGYFITIILFFKSLPTGYMCPKPGHVLHSTKLLEKFAARRVMETAQFVFAVNKKDWYKSGSVGLQSIEKVRLMHAGMRKALLKVKVGEKPWDEKMGLPINQEDVTLTNHLFSLAIIEGLSEVGVHLFKREKEAVFRTWQKIGQAMGIVPEMLNSSYKDAWKQYKKILKRQVSVDNPAGPPLTHALLGAMREMTYNELSMNSLEDITRYFVHKRKSTKSLGLEKPSLLDNIAYTVFHFILGLPIWQWLFHHSKGGFVQRWIKKIGNYVIIKKFKLDSYMKKHPGSDPLEAFSKVMLNSLAQRDMRSFELMSKEERKKSFIIDDDLYLAWDLGGFDLHVTEEGGKIT